MHPQDAKYCRMRLSRARSALEPPCISLVAEMFKGLAEGQASRQVVAAAASATGMMTFEDVEMAYGDAKKSITTLTAPSFTEADEVPEAPGRGVGGSWMRFNTSTPQAAKSPGVFGALRRVSGTGSHAERLEVTECPTGEEVEGPPGLKQTQSSSPPVRLPRQRAKGSKDGEGAAGGRRWFCSFLFDLVRGCSKRLWDPLKIPSKS